MKSYYQIVNDSGEVVKTLPPETTIGSVLSEFVRLSKDYPRLYLGFVIGRHTRFSTITVSEAKFLIVNRQEMIDICDRED